MDHFSRADFTEGRSYRNIKSLHFSSHRVKWAILDNHQGKIQTQYHERSTDPCPHTSIWVILKHWICIIM